jgi:hypothetical protein
MGRINRVKYLEKFLSECNINIEEFISNINTNDIKTISYRYYDPYDFVEQMLTNTFIWINSKEGVQYWTEIYNKFKEWKY